MKVKFLKNIHVNMFNAIITISPNYANFDKRRTTAATVTAKENEQFIR